MKFRLLPVLLISFFSLQFVINDLVILNEEPDLPSTPYNYIDIVLPTHLTTNALNGPGQNAAVDNDNTPADNPVTNEGATLGRVLFYDKNLSANQTISCASCHSQAKGFSDDNVLSIGFEGDSTRRHSMGLTNAVWYDRGRFFWDERAETLEDQVLMPFQDSIEMGMTLSGLISAIENESYYPSLFEEAFGTTEVNADRIGKALAQFIRSMVSVNSKYDTGRAEVGIPTADFPNFTESENNGKTLFFLPKFLGGLSCVGCHSTEAFINPDAGTTNNGLDSVSTTDLGVYEAIPNPAFLGAFKVPSLKNIGLTAPYMHDGRFATLEEVIDHYNSGVQNHTNLNSSLMDDGLPQQLNLTEIEKEDVINFLMTLTDSVLMNDVKFSDPFNIPLPIELLSFTARLIDNEEVLLHWSTSFELNTEKYVIQKSKDGRSFENIGEVRAAGESRIVEEYSFIDKTPLNGQSYYRFEQLDFDGRITYSPIVHILNEEIKEINVYPNPLIEGSNLFVESESELPVQIELYTGQGELILSELLSDNVLNLSRLNSGIYFYKIYNREVSTRGRLSIQ
ncbi:MAG: cytochrome c peroxidase [Saprospiraceae bacterium]